MKKTALITISLVFSLLFSSYKLIVSVNDPERYFFNEDYINIVNIKRAIIYNKLMSFVIAYRPSFELDSYKTVVERIKEKKFFFHSEPRPVSDSISFFKSYENDSVNLITNATNYDNANNVFYSVVKNKAVLCIQSGDCSKVQLDRLLDKLTSNIFIIQDDLMVEGAHLISPVYDPKLETVMGEVHTLIITERGNIGRTIKSKKVLGDVSYYNVTLGQEGYLRGIYVKADYPVDSQTIITLQYPIWQLILFFMKTLVFAFFTALLFLYIIDSFFVINRLKDESVTDELSGLYTRKILGTEMMKKLINNELYTVVVIDGDKFKSINDTYGHIMGDQAIKNIAKAMKQTFRCSDILIRHGGDEFIVILPNCSQATAHDLTLYLEDNLLSMPLPNGVKVHVTCGVAESKGGNLQVTIDAADQDLYRKKSEKGTVRESFCENETFQS